MEENAQKYNAHKQKIAQLRALAEQCQTQFEQIGMRDWVDNTEALIQRLENDSFKVLVLGEFKRGKSTFINALLQEEVLPAFSTPCTAVINEIRYGEEKSATVFFREDLQAEALQDLPDPVQAHLKSHGIENAPPLEVPVDELEAYVVIPDAAEDQARSVRESPYDHVEIMWPLDLCKNGVEIIDSPGLNEHNTRTKVTMDYLTTADAVLFIMTCHQLASKSELEVIDGDLKNAGHNEVFFIANRWDEVRDRERARMQKYAETKLGPRTQRKPPVFFLSALDALDGRLDGDPDRVNGSGVLTVEEALSDFLVNDRGRLKIARPSLQLLTGTAEALNKKIPADRKMLEMQVTDLRDKVENERPEMERLSQERGRIMKKLDQGLRRLEDNVADRVQAKLRDLSYKIEEWVTDDAAGLEAEMTMWTFDHKGKARAVAEEVSALVAKRLQEEQEAWGADEFVRYIHGELELLFEGAAPEIQELMTRVDKMRARVADLQEDELTGDLTGVSGIERAIAGTAGFFLGGAGSAMVGATMGGTEMAKSLVPSVALGVGAILLGVTNPLILIPMLLTAGGIQGMIKTGQATEKIRSQTARNLKMEFQKQAPAIAKEQAKRVIEQASELVNQVDADLQQQLDAAAQSFQDAIDKKTAGEAEVEAQRALLDQASETLLAVNKKLLADLALNQPG